MSPKRRPGRREPSEDEHRAALLARALAGNAAAQHALGVALRDAEEPDPQGARRWLTAAAEQGWEEAVADLGHLLYEGLEVGDEDRDVPSDEAAALPWLRKGAEAGDAWSKTYLGAIYLAGEVVAPDLGRALRWLREAARAGNPMARYLVFSALWVEDAPDEESREAADNLLAAVADGFAPALTMYGRILVFEPYPAFGLAQDLAGGREALEVAAEAGDAEAAYWLGRLHAEGRGVPADPEEAVRWYEAAARDDEVPAAHYALWEHYRDGEGVASDPAMAVAHLRTAAELGDVDAMYGYGLGHTEGAAARVAELGLPIPHNPQEAVRWLEEAAEAGHGKAAAVLVEVLLNDEAIRDREKAFGWIRRCARDGARWAYTLLGEMHEAGDGAPEDLEAAARWYAKAAEAGSPDAMWRLALFAQEGWGMPADLTAASTWLRGAAEAGHLEAIKQLAAHHAAGDRVAHGIPHDWNAAGGLWERAANAGDVPAMVRFGELLCTDPPSTWYFEDGLRWLRAAAEAGNAEGQYQLALALVKYEEPEEARVWLARAADEGWPEAQALLDAGTSLSASVPASRPASSPATTPVASPPEGGTPMTPPKPGDGGLDPSLGGNPGLAAKRLDVALELTKLWLGETSWYAPGSVYEQAAIIGRVFEAYRRQLDEGRPVDPTTVFDAQDNHPAAIGPLEWPEYEDDDDDEDDDEYDEDEDE